MGAEPAVVGWWGSCLVVFSNCSTNARCSSLFYHFEATFKSLLLIWLTFSNKKIKSTHRCRHASSLSICFLNCRNSSKGWLVGWLVGWFLTPPAWPLGFEVLAPKLDGGGSLVVLSSNGSPQSSDQWLLHFDSPFLVPSHFSWKVQLRVCHFGLSEKARWPLHGLCGIDTTLDQLEGGTCLCGS